MKKRFVLCILLPCCIYISACGRPADTNNDISLKDTAAAGGTEFHVEILNDDELQGYLYSQQGISERFAEIDDITGKIIDGECSYSFSDDGWGNSGTLFIQLKEGEINIEVKDFILSDQNTSGFGISGSYYSALRLLHQTPCF